MIDTIIVSGGNIQCDFALDFLKKTMEQAAPEKVLLIAADKGLEFFIRAGLAPDVAVGDFDSLSKEGQAFLKEADSMKIIRLKPEKDDSDTQSALNLAVQGGAREILILGATGTRIDHLLANLELLALAETLGARCTLADANNLISLVPSGTKLEKSGQFGKYVSFFPVGGEVTGLTLEGFRYPLQGRRLTVNDCGLTVSNEITADTARITYDEGTLMMLMTRD